MLNSVRARSRALVSIPRILSSQISDRNACAPMLGVNTVTSVKIPNKSNRWLSQAAALSTSNRIDPKMKVEPAFRLTPTEHRITDLQREALRNVLSVVEDIEEVSPRDVDLLREEIARLGDGFFLLVVAGEYNSGKSSLINALAGRKVLDEGPTPTTAQVTKLKYSDSSFESETNGDNGVLVLGEPISILSNRLQIVDTPGTNAIDRAHESLTRDYIPLCDLVLFVTSADRPFSESERLFLESIRQWGKKVVLVINKMDLLASDTAATMEVVEFVTSAAKSLLGSRPFVFPVSSRLALEAKQNAEGNAVQLKESGLSPLERYMKETLDSKEKFSVKLEASSSVGTAIIDKYAKFLEAAKGVIEQDTRAVAEINESLERYADRVRKGFGAQYARVDNALLHMLDRADIFFDTHIRISNVQNLLHRERLKRDFETEVIANTTKIVARQSEAMAEWLTEMSSRSISETSSTFARRIGRRGLELRAIATPAAMSLNHASHEMEWVHAEDTLISGLSAAVSDLATNYDAINDGHRIAAEVSSSVRTALTLELGAVGLLGVLMGTSTLDVTGVTSTGILASAGLVVLPRRRLALRRELRSRIGTLRKRLQKDLENRVDEHVVSHVTRVRDAMMPFSTFTGEKRRSIDAHLSALEGSRGEISRVRQRIVEMHSDKIH